MLLSQYDSKQEFSPVFSKAVGVMHFKKISLIWLGKVRNTYGTSITLQRSPQAWNCQSCDRCAVCPKILIHYLKAQALIRPEVINCLLLTMKDNTFMIQIIWKTLPSRGQKKTSTGSAAGRISAFWQESFVSETDSLFTL